MSTDRSARRARRGRRRRRSRSGAPGGPIAPERAPAVRNTVSSSSVRPPSGPTMSTTSPDSGNCTVRSAEDAASSSTSAAEDLPTSPTTSAVEARSVTDGTNGRRDCLAAARAANRHFCTPCAARSADHRTTHRCAAHGTRVSTPASVASSTASSPRSPLGIAWTSVTWTAGGSCRSTRSTCTDSSPRPTSVTVARATPPRPSVRTRDSPDRNRRTVAACRPSAPVSAKGPGAGRRSTRKYGTPSPLRRPGAASSGATSSGAAGDRRPEAAFTSRQTSRGYGRRSRRYGLARQVRVAPPRAGWPTP